MFAQLLVSGLVLGCMYGLLGMGTSLIFKASGIMNQAQGDMLTLGAYFGYTFYAILKLPFAVSLIATMLIMFGFGYALQIAVVSNIVKRVGPISVMLATSAISYIIQNGARFTWGAVTLSFPSIMKKSTVKIFGAVYQSEKLLCVGVSIVLMLALHLFLSKTKFGIALRAAATDGTAAKTFGIDVAMANAVTWGLASGLGAIAGILVGPLYGVFTSLGANLNGKGFSGAVMGGMGDIYGAIVGGVILGLLETFVSGYVSSRHKDLIAYIVLLVFLFIKPRGLFNSDAVDE